MNIAHFNTAVSFSDFSHDGLQSPVNGLFPLVMTCHETLSNSPKVVTHLLKNFGISLNEINEYHIGYVKIQPKVPKPIGFQVDGIDRYEYGLLEECIIVPINANGELVGIYGLPYKSSSVSAGISHLLEPNVILEPNHFSKSILRCLHPLDVISLQKQGYQNAYCDLSGAINELTFDRLHQMGVEVIAYFSDAYGSDFDVDHAKELAKYYNMRLCEVLLPFPFTQFGQWDANQWQLFDKRLTNSLSQLGCRNERYQA
jgi:hypothetical protein